MDLALPLFLLLVRVLFVPVFDSLDALLNCFRSTLLGSLILFSLCFYRLGVTHHSSRTTNNSALFTTKFRSARLVLSLVKFNVYGLWRVFANPTTNCSCHVSSYEAGCAYSWNCWSFTSSSGISWIIFREISVPRSSMYPSGCVWYGLNTWPFHTAL